MLSLMLDNLERIKYTGIITFKIPPEFDATDYFDF